MRWELWRIISERTASTGWRSVKFAAKCDRELILRGCEMLGMKVPELAGICIEGMRPYAEDIELLGTEG